MGNSEADFCVEWGKMRVSEFMSSLALSSDLFVRSAHIQVPFLNLMAQIQHRAGGLHIRMGGNTQDFAYWVDSIPNGHATSKEKSDPKNPVCPFSFFCVNKALTLHYLPACQTLTPAVLYSDELFHLAANISSLVNVRWYLGR